MSTAEMTMNPTAYQTAAQLATDKLNAKMAKMDADRVAAREAVAEGAYKWRVEIAGNPACIVGTDIDGFAGQCHAEGKYKQYMGIITTNAPVTCDRVNDEGVAVAVEAQAIAADVSLPVKPSPVIEAARAEAAKDALKAKAGQGK